MTTPKRCVRFIVRDAGGKYCWDSSILHGPPNVTDLNAPGPHALQLVLDILAVR